MALTTYRIDRDGATRLLFLLHGWSAEQHHLGACVPLTEAGYDMGHSQRIEMMIDARDWLARLD